MVVVTGPRIDPSCSAPGHGLEVHGFVPDLYRHLAACDLAVVQGGLTTTMELTAAGTPFIYVPLRHHFEQNFHVRTGSTSTAPAGASTTTTSPRTTLAARSPRRSVAEPAYRPVETDGASRAAACIADLL